MAKSKSRKLADFISDSAIDTAELADGSITPAKLDSTGSYTVADLTVSSSYPDLVIEDSDGTNQSLTIQQVGGASMIKPRSGSNDGELYVTGAVSGTNHMKITSSGNAIFEGSVGIGVGSPNTSLHIATGGIKLPGAIDNNGQINFKNCSTATILMSFPLSNQHIKLYGETDKLYFDSNRSGVGEVLGIDDYGRVTKPKQPAFMAQRTGGNSNPGGSTVYPFNTTYYNIGSGYNTSNYRFTAPVAGLYMFGVQLLTDNSGGRQIIYLRINGSIDYNNTQGYEGSADTEEYNDVQINALFKLNANDYVDVTTGSGANNNLYSSANGQNKFWGVLIG